MLTPTHTHTQSIEIDEKKDTPRIHPDENIYSCKKSFTAHFFDAIVACVSNDTKLETVRK